MVEKDRVPQEAAPEPTWTYLRRVLNDHTGLPEMSGIRTYSLRQTRPAM